MPRKLFVFDMGFGICFLRCMDRDIIDLLGGPGALAETLKVTKAAVINWRLANRRIPWKHRPAIARMAAEKAVALPADFWEAA